MKRANSFEFFASDHCSHHKIISGKMFSMNDWAVLVSSESWKRYVKTRENFLAPFCDFLFEVFIGVEENDLGDFSVLKSHFRFSVRVSITFYLSRFTWWHFEFCAFHVHFSNKILKGLNLGLAEVLMIVLRNYRSWKISISENRESAGKSQFR